MVLHHGSPPIGFDIILEFHAIRSVIIDTAEAVIYFAGWKNESVFFGMGDDVFEYICGHDSRFERPKIGQTGVFLVVVADRF
jgi:hypothetical protein